MEAARLLLTYSLKSHTITSAVFCGSEASHKAITDSEEGTTPGCEYREVYWELPLEASHPGSVASSHISCTPDGSALYSLFSSTPGRSQGWHKGSCLINFCCTKLCCDTVCSISRKVTGTSLFPWLLVPCRTLFLGNWRLGGGAMSWDPKDSKPEHSRLLFPAHAPGPGTQGKKPPRQGGFAKPRKRET